MESTFDYRTVPKDYLHCLNTQCPRSSECVRALIVPFADKSIHSFRIVNPAYAAEEECAYFYLDQPVRYALGMTRMFTDLPYRKALSLKQTLRKQFGDGTYYRMYKKLRLISPEEQALIKEAFSKEGIETEPVFDTYVEQYAFLPQLVGN